METIKQALEVLLKDLQARKEKVADATPDFLVEKTFSRKELEHCQAGSLKNGILRIKVDSSTWLYYFNLHKKEALEKLSGQNSQIKDLKFSLGEISRKKDGG